MGSRCPISIVVMRPSLSLPCRTKHAPDIQTVNGNRFGFFIRIKKQQDLLECEGDAVISGILEADALSGNVTGSLDYELIAADTSIDVGGSLIAARVD